MLQIISRILKSVVATIGITTTVLPTSADTVAAAGVTLTGAAGAWTWGAWAQIVAATTSTQKLTGVFLDFFGGGPADEGEVQVGVGGAGSEVPIATVPLTLAFTSTPDGQEIPVGSRVAARLRTSAGGAETIKCKLQTKQGY